MPNHRVKLTRPAPRFFDTRKLLQPALHLTLIVRRFGYSRMDGQRYALLFGKLKVGVVTQTNSDFPNLWGEIVYDPALEKPESAELRRFVKFTLLNRESTRLIDIEHETDVSQELDAINAELESYKDIIESEDW